MALKWCIKLDMVFLKRMLYCFLRSSIKFQGHMGQKLPNLTGIECSLLWLQFEFTNGFEMIHKTWHCKEDMPYCFSRSSIKFQGHLGWKIDDLNPIWVRLLGRSQLSNPSDFPCSMYHLRTILKSHQNLPVHFSVMLLTVLLPPPRPPPLQKKRKISSNQIVIHNTIF